LSSIPAPPCKKPAGRGPGRFGPFCWPRQKKSPGRNRGENRHPGWTTPTTIESGGAFTHRLPGGPIPVLRTDNSPVVRGRNLGKGLIAAKIAQERVLSAKTGIGPLLPQNALDRPQETFWPAMRSPRPGLEGDRFLIFLATRPKPRRANRRAFPEVRPGQRAGQRYPPEALATRFLIPGPDPQPRLDPAEGRGIAEWRTGLESPERGSDVPEAFPSGNCASVLRIGR
jgi:hypothetical protein